MKRILIWSVFIFASYQSFSQVVVMKDYISKDWSGTLSDQVNWSKDNLIYTFKYDSANQLKQFYNLKLQGTDNKGNVEFSFLIPHVEIRDTRSFWYMDIILTKNGETHTLTAKYDKLQHFLIFNGNPHPDCSTYTDPDWMRYDAISSYDQLLKDVVTDFDRNVKFDCYAGTK